MEELHDTDEAMEASKLHRNGRGPVSGSKVRRLTVLPSHRRTDFTLTWSNGALVREPWAYERLIDQ